MVVLEGQTGLCRVRLECHSDSGERPPCSGRAPVRAGTRGQEGRGGLETNRPGRKLMTS